MISLVNHDSRVRENRVRSPNDLKNHGFPADEPSLGMCIPLLKWDAKSSQNHLSIQCEAPKIAKLVNITPNKYGLWYL
jgi:hypothetical protein